MVTAVTFVLPAMCGIMREAIKKIVYILCNN